MREKEKKQDRTIICPFNIYMKIDSDFLKSWSLINYKSMSMSNLMIKQSIVTDTTLHQISVPQLPSLFSISLTKMLTGAKDWCSVASSFKQCLSKTWVWVKHEPCPESFYGCCPQLSQPITIVIMLIRFD